MWVDTKTPSPIAFALFFLPPPLLQKKKKSTCQPSLDSLLPPSADAQIPNA